MPEPKLSDVPGEETVTAETAAGDEMAAQILQLTEQKAELQDARQRLQAEFDNFRRRSERERSEFVQYAGGELIRELLPILDDFERALSTDAGHKDYAKGVEMIYTRMADTLKKAGLEPIEAVGQPFDPHVHQAVEKVQTADAQDNSVIGEFQKGYFFKGKLLRPSMVRVAIHQ